MNGLLQQPLLQAASRAIAAALTSRAAAAAVLRVCVDGLGVAGGAVYLLDLSRGRYRPFVCWPETPRDAGHDGMAADEIALPTCQLGPAPAFAADSALAPGMRVYAMRGATCVGMMQLDELDVATVGPETRAELVGVANLLVPIYEREFAENLLGALPEPIDFTQSERDYFNDVGTLIANASGMQYAILRERDGRCLRCVAQWEHDAEERTLSLDLDRHADHPAMAALRGETVVVDRRADSQAEARLRSFVILPVRVGRDIFGVLSLGTSCSFGYSPLELRGFDMIANAIGVSIANFRSSREANRRIAEYTEAAAAVTAVEIARQVRHDVAVHSDNCHLSLARLWRRLGPQAAAVEAELDAVSSELAAIRASLDRMRVGLAPSMRIWTTVSVRELWTQALSQVAGQLDARRIGAYLRGSPDAELYAMPDELRSVFLNLLLNSIDAFDRTGRRARHVRLAVREPSAPGGELLIEYSDNAGGVHPGHLRRPEGLESLSVEQALFERGTTSKQEGSGLGLWLTRRILGDHCGSISLLEHRGRIVFAIRVPQQPRKQIAA